ncbi:AraC family transcriptional regulator [Photobacterium salinisoli]|uniref:AraC family transcriptional regulator n=1 Tax=Photobacterium salinisoli TaxID=1616783 RepID=UPI0013C3EC48|nr:helix-turn-helix transcriptional regulator [Photobacterium salinisoli]
MTKNIDKKTYATPDGNTLIATHSYQPLLINTLNMVKGFHDQPHQHPWHQIIFPSRGLLKCSTGTHHFYIPHHRALFIPAHTRHESRALQDTTFIAVYLNPECLTHVPAFSQPIEVTPFFRELILKLRHSVLRDQAQPPGILRLLAVLEDELSAEKDSSLELPMPQDRRLAPIVDELLSDPGSTKTLAQWARQAGATERTLSRVFQKEIQLTFPQWRQRLRLMTAMTLLEQGLPVQDVAHQVGYQSVSAFIEAFRLAFKLTPQQFKQQRTLE